MKIFQTLAVSLLSLAMVQANAQSENSKELKKGTVVFADGSSAPGFIKDNIRKDASVTFTPETGGKKKIYAGAELTSVTIEGTKYICIKGDFFKILSEGELSFLQKSSDASGKPTYNGNEAIFSSGTEGNPNDYFIYNNTDKQLKLVSKKNLDEVIKASFSGSTAAIDKAKTVQGDLSRLKEAVDLYNNRNK